MAQQNHATETIDDKNARRLPEAYQTANGDPGTIGTSHCFVPAGKRRLLGRDSLRTRAPELPVKRLRRISLNIEHREVSVSITQTVVTSGQSGSQPTAGDGAQPENCPECGAPWITVVAPAGESATDNAARLLRALQQCGAHVHISAACELRICSKSLEQIRTEEIRTEQIRTERIKESL